MVSYIPDIVQIFGQNLGAITGGDAQILGVVAFFAMFVLWVMLGAGFEAGVIIFAPFVFALSFWGFLPLWAGFIAGLVMAVAVMRFFGVLK